LVLQGFFYIKQFGRFYIPQGILLTFINYEKLTEEASFLIDFMTSVCDTLAEESSFSTCLFLSLARTGRDPISA
jgi:hypothetical protein